MRRSDRYRKTFLCLVVILLLPGFSIFIRLENPAAYAQEKVEDRGEGEQKDPGSGDDSDLIRTGKDVVEGIGDLFGGSRSGTAQPGTRIQFRIVDWAGRPVDGTVTLTHREGHPSYTQSTTASLATVIVEKPGTYRISLDPARGLPSPPLTIDVPGTGTLTVTLRVLPEKGEAGGPTAPVPEAGPRTTSRDLTRGSRLSIQGWVQDEAGRPTDAFIRVFDGRTEIGHAYTTAARFSMFDLGPGEYRVTAISRRPGAIESSRNFTLRGGIPRLTITVRHARIASSPIGAAVRTEDVVEVVRKPDLTAKSFELVKTGVCISGASLFEFRVTLTNRGTADAPPTGSSPMLRVYNDRNSGWATEIPLYPLRKGARIPLIVPIRYSSRYRGLVSSSDTLGFIVKVDHRNLVDELNESNNGKIIHVRVPKQCKPLIAVPSGVGIIGDKKLPGGGIKNEGMKKIPLKPVPNK